MPLPRTLLLLAFVAAGTGALPAQQSAPLASYVAARAKVDRAITALGGDSVLAGLVIGTRFHGVQVQRHQSHRPAPPWERTPITGEVTLDFARRRIGFEQRTEFPALSRTMFVKYAGASGDFNPMHHDDTIATQVGNPSVFGHGVLTMGLAARVVKDWFGPEAIRKFQVRFSKQVWPGDVLTCTAVVTGKRDDGGDKLVDLDVTVVNQNGDKAITGAATAVVA